MKTRHKFVVLSGFEPERASLTVIQSLKTLVCTVLAIRNEPVIWNSQEPRDYITLDNNRLYADEILTNRTILRLEVISHILRSHL